MILINLPLVGSERVYVWAYSVCKSLGVSLGDSHSSRSWPFCAFQRQNSNSCQLVLCLPVADPIYRERELRYICMMGR